MTTARRALGFSWPILIALAAPAGPRVGLHDLGVIEEGRFVNGLLVAVPPACWIAAVHAQHGTGSTTSAGGEGHQA